MNIKQAKSIQISMLLDKLGLQPSKSPSQTNKHEIWYLSPFRAEKTPSFHLNVAKNIWFDFGMGKGGDVLGFVSSFLESSGESHTVVDSLRWLRNMAGGLKIEPIERNLPSDHQPTEGAWVIKKSKPLAHKALIQYLESRGIDKQVGQDHLREVHVQNTATQKGYFALGFPNEEGGFEVRNQFFKGTVKPKAISFVRGAKPKPETVHVFEGFMDYLTAITQLKTKMLSGDALILNSLSCLSQAWPYIKGYGYRTLYSWLDNDSSGERATKALAEFVKSEEGLVHVAMNKLYLPHKDVNACHVHRLFKP